MYEIGPYLRAALKQRGMTQKELASAMGMTKEHISTLCLNKRRPSLDTLEKICSILDMSYSEFFTTQNSSRTVSLSDNEYNLLCDYRHLDDIERRAVSTLTMTLRSGHPKHTEKNHLPVYKREVSGLAAAGQPLFSTIEDEYIAVPQKYMDSTRYLIVKAKGDSMEPDIQNGDYIIAEINSIPNQGEISLVSVDSPCPNSEYTIKKFYRYGDQVELHSLNAKYNPMVYPISDIKSARRVVYVIPKTSDA